MQKAEEETSFNYHKKKVLKLLPVCVYLYVALLYQMCKKNKGTVCGVTNQIAGFQIWTNQKAVFGPRDLAA